MKRLSIFMLILMVAACKAPAPTTDVDTKLSALFEAYRDYLYFSWPEYATYNGVYDYNDRLNDQSMAFEQEYLDSMTGFLNELHKIDKEILTKEQRLNYDLFEFSLQSTVDQYSYGLLQYLSFSQQNGFHITFPQITQVQPLETDEDVTNYLKRLAGFPEQVENIIQNLRTGNEKGVAVYCSIADAVLEQLKDLSSDTYESSPLYTVMERSEALQARLPELQKVVEDAILPGYRSLCEFYRTEGLPNCRKEPGISSLPGGKEYYEYLVKLYTTSNVTPDEVFDIGMKEVERIGREMSAIKGKLGAADMTTPEFFEDLRSNPKYYYTDKEDYLNAFREILRNMDAQLPDIFGRLPKTPYDLKELELYRAKAAPAAYYYSAPEDGSRPGYFYVNTYQLDSRPKYTMTALALHEAVPGHHLQIALAMEMEDVPWFRTQLGATAFTEGWGLYAEYLGYETGMYEDSLQHLGALSFEMWRACRLVVDVGLHYKGWSRDEAMAFMRSNVPLSELDVISEIDRYISWPGQALAYKIGELKLKELRRYSSEMLGDAFDLKEFHDEVLAYGAIPLYILEEQIDIWLDSKD